MAIVFHRSGAGNGTVATSVPMLMSGTVDAGELIVVGAEVRAQGRTITVSDTQGNVYHLAHAQTNAGATSTSYIYYAMNAVGGTLPTITFAISGAAEFMRGLASSYSGLATTEALDQAAGAEGVSNSPSSGSQTTTVANELIWGFYVGITSTDTFTPGSGFGNVQDAESGIYTEDKIVSATGSYLANGSVTNASQNWTMQMATFADTPVSPPSSPTTWLRHRV